MVACFQVAAILGWDVQTVAITAGLLCPSNIFMTFAWYAHLKELYQKRWLIFRVPRATGGQLTGLMRG